MFDEILIFGVLGILSGLLAGMFGIGGGLIMVPVLIGTFINLGFENEIIVQLAIGTSISCIIFTGLSSANAHRKKNSIDFEMHTAGAFKRTLTTLGENTDEGRKKFKSDLEDLHLIFKDFVKEQRPQVDTDVVATGEVWQGKEAIEVGLIDSIETSDNYLVGLSKDVNLFEIEFVEKKNLSEKFAFSMHLVLEKLVLKFYDLINRDRFLS